MSAEPLLFVVGLAAGPVVFLLVLLAVNALLAPKHPTDVKSAAYECGIPQADSPWHRLNIRFSTVALLLVIFDAETVLLFAVASGVRGSVLGAIEVAVFSTFLALGLFYAWKKGLLKWPA